MEWTKYTTKEALKDNDELMILDTDGKANKRTLMDKVWDYVVDKMTTAVIAKLGTTNKTLIGAVNELNSNRLSAIRIGANSETTIPLQPYCSALVLGTAASHINGFYLISRKPDTVSITPLIDGLKNTDFQVTVVDSALIAIKTQSATDMRVIYMK